MKRELVAEILALPVVERMRLVEAIWDGISSVIVSKTADSVKRAVL